MTSATTISRLPVPPPRGMPPKLPLSKEDKDDDHACAAMRRGSVSARTSKVGEKSNALEQLAQAAEAIRKQRTPDGRPASRHTRQRSLSTSEIPDGVKRQMMRMKAEEELRTTEETYVRDLEYLKKRVMDPLDRREILTKSEQQTMFSNLRQILDLHLHLLEDLKKTDQPWDPFLKMLYISYSTTHAKSSSFVAQLLKGNPAFAAFITDALSDNPGKLRLEDYLIKPVQRICKYPLLFSELARHTDSPHCKAITEVAKKMSEVAEFVNSAQRRVESVPRLLELAQLLDLNGKASFTELISPERHFIRELVCDVLCEGGESEKLNVLLFNDVILLARPPSVLRKKYELRQEIPVTGTLKASQSEGSKLALHFSDNARPLFAMRGLTADERRDWIRAVDAIVQQRAGSPRVPHDGTRK